MHDEVVRLVSVDESGLRREGRVMRNLVRLYSTRKLATRSIAEPEDGAVNGEHLRAEPRREEVSLVAEEAMAEEQS